MQQLTRVVGEVEEMEVDVATVDAQEELVVPSHSVELRSRVCLTLQSGQEVRGSLSRPLFWCPGGIVSDAEIEETVVALTRCLVLGGLQALLRGKVGRGVEAPLEVADRQVPPSNQKP